MSKRITLLLTLILLVGSIAGLTQAQDAGTISYGQTVTGTLTGAGGQRWRGRVSVV